MDKKELEEGLKDVIENSEKDGGEDKGSSSEEWSPDLDWVMKSVGPFFNNNTGLGELLLDKLSESGVNTQGAALTAIVKVLKRFNDEYRSLGKAIGSNLDMLDQLSDQSEDLTQAVEDLLKEMGVSVDEGADIGIDGGGGTTPPDTGGSPDMGVDMGAATPADMGGGMPPADMGGGMPPADMGGGMPPADMGGGMPPADMGGGMPPADMGGGMPPDMGAAPTAGMVSDENMKDVKKYVVSDEQMKNVAHKLVGAYYKRRNAGRRTSLNPDIISICKRKDLGSEASPKPVTITGDDDEG